MAAGHVIQVSVLADTKPMQKSMSEVNKGLNFDGLRRTVKGIGLSLAGATAVGAAAAIKLGTSLITAGETASTSNSRIANIANQMGIFGAEASKVSTRVAELANTTARASGVDQNAIKLATAKLLTFKDLAASAKTAGGAFDRATQATVDMASAGFGTAEQNAVQLGKALADPVKGITALGRAGVTFTETEKQKIATLVKSNKLGEAQNMILTAVETQVGGTAKATANASDKIKVAWSQATESLGQKLLPVFESAAAWLVDTGIPAFERVADTVATSVGPALAAAGEWLQSTLIPAFATATAWVQANLLPALTNLGTTIATNVLPVIQSISTFLTEWQTWLLPIAAAIAAMVVAWNLWSLAVTAWTTITKLASAAQAILNAVLNANPIGVIILAIVGLVAAITALYMNNETARKVIDTSWSAIKTAVSTVVSAVVAYVQWVIRTWRSVIDTAISVASAVVGAWNRLKQGTSDAIQSVIEWFTRLPGRIWSAVTSIPAQMAQLGRDMISGLVGALSPSRVIAKINAVIGDALGWAKRMLGISSPSRVFRAYGRWTSEGLALGISDRTTTVTSAVRRIGHQMTAAAPARLPLPTVTATRHSPPVQIVVQALTPGVEVGRAVAKALDDYRRAGGRI